MFLFYPWWGRITSPFPSPGTVMEPPYKPLRLEKFWLTHPTFMDSVSSWWEDMSVTSRSKVAIMHKKLKRLQGHLIQWNKTTFGDIFKDKTTILEILASIQCNAMDNGFNEETKLQQRDLMHQLNKKCD